MNQISCLLYENHSPNPSSLQMNSFGCDGLRMGKLLDRKCRQLELGKGRPCPVLTALGWKIKRRAAVLVL